MDTSLVLIPLPLFFVFVMDTTTRNVEGIAPYILPYVDDIFLESDNKNALEEFVQKWNDRLTWSQIEFE